jgi:formylglycine-generating enzyme required for sulfatase activity
MLPVTGGTYAMGSNDVLDFGASPPHLVTVGSFYMDPYEITYEKWTEVRNWALTHGYLSTEIAPGQPGSNPVGANNPVTSVNWCDILKWCNARSEKDGLTPVFYTNGTLSTVYRAGEIDLTTDAVQWAANGYRLPTEAEWEFAARGGTKTKSYIYSGSNTAENVAWNYANSANATHPVGQKAANELGLFDMSGNVWEWCWDRNGSYSSSAQTDPKGPASGISRVLRGGSYDYVSNYCRTAYRFNANPVVRYYAVGFRCIQK